MASKPSMEHIVKKVNMALRRSVVVLALLMMSCVLASAETNKEEKEKKKIGKNVLDYTESDIYRLADQWDVSNLIIIITFKFVYVYV